MKTIAFSALYISFIYVYPVYKLPFGNVSHIRLDDIFFAIALVTFLISKKDFSTLRNDKTFKAFSIYIAYLGFTLFIAYLREGGLTRPIQFGGFFYLKFLQYFFIYIMIRTCNPIPSSSGFKLLLGAMALYTAIAAVMQSQGLITLRYDPSIPQNFRHATSTLSFNYAHLGLFSVVVIGLLATFYEDTKNLLVKGVFIFLIMAALYTLMLSGSRSGIFGSLIVLMVIAASSRQKGAYIGGGILVIVALLIYGVPDIFVDRVSNAFDEDATGAGRVKSWMKLGEFLNVSVLNLLFGVGFMQFKFSVAVDIFEINAGHNNFLNAYVESGSIGFILFVYLISVIFKKFYDSRKLSVLNTGRFAIWCGLLATCMSQETLTVNFAMTSFMGFIMFTLGLMENYDLQKNASEKNMPSSTQVGLRGHRNDRQRLFNF